MAVETVQKNEVDFPDTGIRRCLDRQMGRSGRSSI
jgi:hypothetical protein